MTQPVTLTAWIDILDPWSWVTATRLERLAARYGDRVTLAWRAFLRYPEKQVRDPEEWRKATVEWLEPAAAEPGLDFSLWATTNAPPTHSAPALAAALVAEELDPARAPAYRRALFAAHFTQNRTVSDGSTLIAVAREVGLDEDGFAMGLRGRYSAFVKQVIAQHNEGATRGVTATPAVVIGEEFLVRGPASEDQYRELIDQVLGEPAAGEAPEAAPTPSPAADAESTEAAPAEPAPVEAEAGEAGSATPAPAEGGAGTPAPEAPDPAPPAEEPAPASAAEGPTDAPAAADDRAAPDEQAPADDTATPATPAVPEGSPPAAPAPAKKKKKKAPAKKKSPAKKRKKSPAKKKSSAKPADPQS